MGLFGAPKITLMLDKYNFKPGEMIKGKVKLNLKKPVSARKLEVAFIGRMIQKQSAASVAGLAAVASGNRARSRTDYTTVFNFKMPLAGEKEYHKEEYPFEIKIPDSILQDNQKTEGKAATAATALKVLGGISRHVDWYVKAELDVPMKLDIKNSQKIILSQS